MSMKSVLRLTLSARSSHKFRFALGLIKGILAPLLKPISNLAVRCLLLSPEALEAYFFPVFGKILASLVQ